MSMWASWAILVIVGILILSGLTLLSDAESTILPLLKQYNSGIPIDELVCSNTEHHLAIRDNGKPMCAFESTLTKLGLDVYKSFEDDDALLSLQSIDLSGIVLKSDVLEGDYLVGQYSESKGDTVSREPPVVPFNFFGTIVLPDGVMMEPTAAEGHSYAEKNVSILEYASPVQSHLEYAPEYIPDGQELKFIVYNEYMSPQSFQQTTFVYAPFPVIIDPQTESHSVIYDTGGITLSVTTIPSFESYSQSDDENWKKLTNGDIINWKEYQTKIYMINGTINGIIGFDLSNGYHIGITSYSYDATVLLKMAEHILQKES